MKLFFGMLLFMIALSGCSSHTDDAYYDRANKANDKAQSELQKEKF